MNFKNPVINQIAQDCGLHIDFSNPKATMREIEFFAEKVLEFNQSNIVKEKDGWIKTNGLKPNIPKDVRIEVKFRDDITDFGHVDDWIRCWKDNSKAYDIIEYRIEYNNLED